MTERRKRRTGRVFGADGWRRRESDGRDKEDGEESETDSSVCRADEGSLTPPVSRPREVVRVGQHLRDVGGERKLDGGDGRERDVPVVDKVGLRWGRHSWRKKYDSVSRGGSRMGGEEEQLAVRLGRVPGHLVWKRDELSVADDAEHTGDEGGVPPSRDGGILGRI